MKVILDGVSKYYYDQGKATKGVENISLTMDTNSSFVVLTGESGSGKTTLIKLVTGLEDFDEGDIYFDDQPFSALSDNERQKVYSKYVSFVFQDYNLIEWMSGEKNIVLALLKHGYNVKNAKLRAQEALKQVGLYNMRKKKTSKLSGGERQRVAIARSLALDSKIIVFDEPTGNLDENTSKTILGLLNDIKKDKLILYVTHDYPLVESLATRHIVLSDGNVIKDEVIVPNEEKEEKNEEVLDEARKAGKIGFKNHIYSTFLLNFTKVGRSIFTFAMIFLLSAICIGFSTIFGYANIVLNGGFTATQVTNCSVLGNEVLVNKEENKTLDFVSSEASVIDKGGVLVGTPCYLYDKKEVDNLALPSSEGDDIYSQLNGYFALQNEEFTSYHCVKGSDEIKDGEIFVLLPSVNEKYIENNYLYRVLKGMYDIDLVGTIIPTLATKSSSDTFGKNFLSSCPSLKIVGIGCCEQQLFSSSIIDGESVNSYDPIFMTNSNTLKNYQTYLQSMYESLATVDLSPSNNMTNHLILTLNQYLYNFIGEMDFSNSDDYSEFYIDYSWVKDESKSEKQIVALSDEYKDKNIVLSVNHYKINLDDLDPLYLDLNVDEEHKPGIIYVNLGLMTEFILDQNIHTVLCFDKTSQAQSYANSFSLEGSEASYRKVYEYKSSVSISGLENKSIPGRISMIVSYVYFFAFQFLICFIARKIISRLYYRKEEDLKVLSYIGYTKSDTILINFTYFLILSIVSLVIFTLTFDYEMLSIVFQYLTPLMILSYFLVILFAGFLSLPSKNRKRGK